MAETREKVAKAKSGLAAFDKKIEQASSELERLIGSHEIIDTDPEHAITTLMQSQIELKQQRDKLQRETEKIASELSKAAPETVLRFKQDDLTLGLRNSTDSPLVVMK